jgi:hypothetical protein
MLFDKSTVLVLGAGASNPYNFPLGTELKTRIINNTMSGRIGPSSQFLEAGFGPGQIQEFHKDLIRSFPPTIDAFLEDRPSCRDICTFAIAQILMEIENEDFLYPHKDWYPLLFKELRFKDSESTPEVSGIITFNYDRSLDHYLAETIRRTFEGQARSAALRKLGRLPILHVHGMLGAYPDVPYQAKRTTVELLLGAAGISMVHDKHLDEAEAFVQARELIEKASSVVFLGFGYDDRSLRRLGVLDNNGSTFFLGTAKGLSPEQKEKVKTMFNGKIGLEETEFTIDAYLHGFHAFQQQARGKLKTSKKP